MPETAIDPAITDKEALKQHFAEQVHYFLIENDFNDGPTLEDLIDEFLDAYEKVR